MCYTVPMGKKLIAPIGQRFGRWTVLEDLGGCPSKWLCLCDCGKRVAVRADHLRSGRSRSCRCLTAELSKERGANVVKAAIACMQAMNYDGTNISLISRPEQRPNRGNVTGVLGVSPRGNRFRATLYLRGKQVYLGTYDTIEEATEARRLGEEKYFKPVIEEFEREKTKAELTKGAILSPCE